MTGAGRRIGRRARHVTVVQSDVVASTRLVAEAGPRDPDLLVRHRSLIARAVARWGGRFMSHSGDGTLATFDRPAGALAASVEAQRALAAEPWPEGLAVRVRMGVHAGDVYEVESEPFGLTINHGARIMGAAHAGQVVVTDAVVEALDDPLGTDPVADLALAEAGWHTLRDHGGPVRLRQVVGDGLTVVLPRPPAELVGDAVGR